MSEEDAVVLVKKALAELKTRFIIGQNSHTFKIVDKV